MVSTGQMARATAAGLDPEVARFWRTLSTRQLGALLARMEENACWAGATPEWYAAREADIECVRGMIDARSHNDR